MSRRLILIRHAKSSWADISLQDHDRPLAKRGIEACVKLKIWLDKLGVSPELTLCSTALRAKQTCEGLGLSASAEFIPSLYLASPNQIAEALLEVPKARKEIAVVAHNPGIGELAISLISEEITHPSFSRYPTGAISVFQLESFAVLPMNEAKLEAFITPREL